MSDYQNQSASGYAKQHNGNIYTTNTYHGYTPPPRQYSPEERKRQNEQLLKAAEEGQLHRIEHLLRLGADVDYADRGGFTALGFAAKAGKTDVAKSLIRAGADVNADTALHFAVQAESPDIVEALIASGADVNKKDIFLRVALHFAAQAGNVGIMNMLISSNADLDKSDLFGATPLHKAVSHGQEGAVQVLCRNGAKTDTAGSTGMTALHLAIKSKHVPHDSNIVETLVLAGVNVNARDDLARTALHFTTNRDARSLLESHGAIE